MDIPTLQTEVTSRLPQRARWLTPDGTPLDFTFYSVPRRLADLLTTEGCQVDSSATLTAFGEYDYAGGGGARPWLAINDADSRVYAIDVESDEPAALLNSSLQAFIQTFCFLDKFASKREPLPSSIVPLVEECDPEAYPNSEWRYWVDYLVAHNP